MNIVVIDEQTEGVLYGHTIFKMVNSSDKDQNVKLYRIPGEAYVAFLAHRYADVPEVTRYLAVYETEGLNPRKGKLLQAIDDVIDIDPQEWENALASCDLL
jgi:hypothetical protein